MIKRRVSIVVFYNKDSFMIQDRRKISKWGEEFGIFGGAIEGGESPEEALKREMKEELGMQISDYKLFKHDVVFVEEIDGEVERFVYLSKIPKNKVECFEGQIIIVKFNEINELKMLKEDLKLLKEVSDIIKK